MLSCKKASVLISQSLERELTKPERWSLKFHLMICKYCKRFQQQISIINKTLKNFRHETEHNTELTLSDEARSRIQKAINQS